MKPPGGGGIKGGINPGGSIGGGPIGSKGRGGSGRGDVPSGRRGGRESSPFSSPG